MNRIIFILVVTILPILSAKAQTPEKFVSTEFSQQLCIAMSDALTEEDKTVSMNAIVGFTHDNEVYMRETMVLIKKAYPDRTDLEIFKTLYISAYHSLVDSCAAIDQLLMKMYGPCPQPTKMLDLFLDSTNAFVTQRLDAEVNYIQLNDEYAVFMSNLIMEHEASLSKTYTNMGDWLNDMESYLFLKSKPYFKMILGYLVESQTVK